MDMTSYANADSGWYRDDDDDDDPAADDEKDEKDASEASVSAGRRAWRRTDTRAQKQEPFLAASSWLLLAADAKTE